MLEHHYPHDILIHILTKLLALSDLGALDAACCSIASRKWLNLIYNSSGFALVDCLSFDIYCRETRVSLDIFKEVRLSYSNWLLSRKISLSSLLKEGLLDSWLERRLPSGMANSVRSISLNGPTGQTTAFSDFINTYDTSPTFPSLTKLQSSTIQTLAEMEWLSARFGHQLLELSLYRESITHFCHYTRHWGHVLRKLTFACDIFNVDILAAISSALAHCSALESFALFHFSFKDTAETEDDDEDEEAERDEPDFTPSLITLYRAVARGCPNIQVCRVSAMQNSRTLSGSELAAAMASVKCTALQDEGECHLPSPRGFEPGFVRTMLRVGGARMKTINLWGKKDLWVRDLTAIGEYCPNLEVLELESEGLGRLLKLQCHKYDELDGTHEKILRGPFRQIASRFPQLTKLSLSTIRGVNDDVLARFAKASPLLRSLSLYGLNSITDRGLCAFSNYSLSLTFCSILYCQKVTHYGFGFILSTSPLLYELECDATKGLLEQLSVARKLTVVTVLCYEAYLDTDDFCDSSFSRNTVKSLALLGFECENFGPSASLSAEPLRALARCCPQLEVFKCSYINLPSQGFGSFPCFCRRLRDIYIRYCPGEYLSEETLVALVTNCPAFSVERTVGGGRRGRIFTFSKEGRTLYPLKYLLEYFGLDEHVREYDEQREKFYGQQHY